MPLRLARARALVEQRADLANVGAEHVVDHQHIRPAIAVYVRGQADLRRIVDLRVDGPDFDGHQVDFDDLMARLGRHKPTERIALDTFNESCRMRNGTPATGA